MSPSVTELFFAACVLLFWASWPCFLRMQMLGVVLRFIFLGSSAKDICASHGGLRHGFQGLDLSFSIEKAIQRAVKGVAEDNFGEVLSRHRVAESKWIELTTDTSLSTLLIQDQNSLHPEVQRSDALHTAFSKAHSAFGSVETVGRS